MTDDVGMMRGIVLLDSLVDRQLPDRMRACVRHRYGHLLGGELPVEVVELSIQPHHAAELALQLAERLLPERFYCHILTNDLMYVIFPGIVAIVRRADPVSITTAQQVGERFNIPLKQMRFGEMFDKDHPDDPDADVQSIQGAA
jgi:hypothetical protein